MSCGNDTTNNRPIGIGYSDGQANSLAELLNVNVSSVSAVSITPTGGTLYVYGTLSAASFSGLPAAASTTNPAGSVGEVQLHGPGTVFSAIPNITVTGGTTLVSVQNVFTNVTATTETITTANIATANLTGTVNGLSFSGSLSDVTITSPTNGQAVCWNGTAWVNSSIPGAGITAISAATDVTITSPTTGQILGWNGSDWVNSSIAAYQPLDATLTTIANHNTAADVLIYFSAVDGAASTTLTSYIRTLLDDTTAANARTTLGVSVSNCADVTVTTPADGHVLVWNGSIWRNLASSVLTGTAGGSTTQVQYNAAGVLAGNSNLVFTVGTGLLQASTLSATNFSGVSFSGSCRDVTITSPTTGQITAWNGTKWVNSSLANYQPYDATLQAIANQSTGANILVYFSGIDLAASATFTSAGRAFCKVADTMVAGDIFYATGPNTVTRLAAPGGGREAVLIHNGSNAVSWLEPTDPGTYLKTEDASTIIWGAII